MSSALETYLYQHINRHGPMDVGTFMNIALGHPQHGYYMKKDPLGAAGDFTTAPEISQMFGEMLGAWVADVWMQMGSPTSFGLVECGPGRATLMADIMRATTGVEGFHSACNLHLLEMSPVLRDMQAEKLEQYNPQWHEGVGDVPLDYPHIIIGNEFLDALPFRQLVYLDGAWVERVVGLGDDERLIFGVRAASPDLLVAIPEALKMPEQGAICEVSPARYGFIANVSDVIKRSTGAALFIDYGYTKSAYGETFQALYKHQSVDVFDHVGDADLTSHVDFEAVAKAAGDACVFGPCAQGAFLKALGIEGRAQSLMKNADDKQRSDIQSALHRLTASDQMGSLFKVIGFTHSHDRYNKIHPAGFSR